LHQEVHITESALVVEKAIALVQLQAKSSDLIFEKG